ncbi:DUF3291 domain-containing protein [Nocardiopsis valliformis]|uniref:DUF3291 domain-containing protein n=1 Tax=Nocardiopsis valliformis TaxID=239974 RepID=UPI00034DED37|nr:DUF3291 domain-containing protein [Nocardiopsis valliformis]
MSQPPHTPVPPPAPSHHLAQINVGFLKAPLDHASMAEFVELLDPINALADRSPGFVWRLVGEGESDATRMRPLGDDLLINLSVWESVESLWDFTYQTEHLELLRRRRSWFERFSGAHLALWWIPAGTVPTPEEGERRLETLHTKGPSAEAFTLRNRFGPPATPRFSHS